MEVVRNGLLWKFSSTKGINLNFPSVWFHNLPYRIHFISSYYYQHYLRSLLDLICHLCFPHFLCNVPHLLSVPHSIMGDQLSCISSHYVSILSLPCFPHILCNGYHVRTLLSIPYSMIYDLSSSPLCNVITEHLHVFKSYVLDFLLLSSDLCIP